MLGTLCFVNNKFVLCCSNSYIVLDPKLPSMHSFSVHFFRYTSDMTCVDFKVCTSKYAHWKQAIKTGQKRYRCILLWCKKDTANLWPGRDTTGFAHFCMFPPKWRSFPEWRNYTISRRLFSCSRASQSFAFSHVSLFKFWNSFSQSLST